MHRQAREYNYSRLLHGLSYPRSACSHYSRSGIRIHTQCILPEQQGQASRRHGSNAGERLQQSSARHTGKARETSRCGTQNANVIQAGRLQQSRHGGRYSRFPRQPPFGTGNEQMHHPVQRREELVKYIPDTESFL